MKPEESHFTGNSEELAQAGAEQARRDELAIASLEFTQAVQSSLAHPPAERSVNPQALAMGQMKKLLDPYQGFNAYFDDTPTDHRLVDHLNSQPILVISKPYDPFTEQSTGTPFVCAAVLCKSIEGVTSALVAAVPRGQEVPAGAPVTCSELSAAVPVALARLSDVQPPIWYTAQQHQYGNKCKTNFTTADPVLTENLMRTETPRIIQALQ